MSRTAKKTISLLLSFCLILTTFFFFPTIVFADSFDPTWPVDAAIGIFLGYGNTYSNGSFHGGIDLSRNSGGAIYAAESGYITIHNYGCTGSHYSGTMCSLGKNCPAYKAAPNNYGSFGNYATIKHDDTFTTLYGHMISFCISDGSYVQKGQKIGEMGQTGYTTGVHLHFEVRKNGSRVNPTIYLTSDKRTNNYHFEGTHTHTYVDEYYEAAHPHKKYKKCSCGDWYYTGETQYLSTCEQCNNLDKCTGYNIGIEASGALDTLVDTDTVKITITPHVNDRNAYDSEIVKNTLYILLPDGSTKSIDFGKEKSKTLYFTGNPSTLGTYTYYAKVETTAGSFTGSPTNGSVSCTLTRPDLTTHYFTTDEVLYYRIKFDGLDTYATVESGGNVASYARKKNSGSTQNQVWKLIKDSNNNYTIESLQDGTVLDVNKGAYVNGNNILSYTSQGSDNQKWELCKYNSTQWYIKPINTRAGVLDVVDGSNKDGANIQLYKINGTAAQRVTFVKPYQVEYDANGGTGAPSTMYKNYNVALSLSSIKPTKTGYNFKGWATSPSATTTTYQAGGTYSGNSDLVLYAVWEKADTTDPTCTITSTNNVASSQSVTLKMSDDVGIAGYYWHTPDNWAEGTYYSTSSTTITKTVSEPGSYMVIAVDTSGNISRSAQITFYKTTLNANGGSVSPTSVLTEKGKSFTFPTPTYSGKTYNGWSTSSTATSGVKTLTPSGNATYYAVWSTPDTTNPTGSISSTNNVASSQTVTLKLSDNIGVAGYYWGTSSTYANNTYSSTSASSATKTVSLSGTYYLTVKDTSGNVSTTYSITFYKTTLNANGGSVSPTSVLTEKGKSFTFPTPSYSGKTYEGWSASSFGNTGVKSHTPSSDSTYYAVWSTPDTTNPTGSISSTNNVASSQTVTLKLSDNVGIAGYYWGTSSTYANNTYSSTSASSAAKTVSSSGTYYLTVKDTSGNVSTTYSVTFYKTTLNANGGSVSPSSILTEKGKSFTFPTPSYSGKTYVGWSTSSSASTGIKSLTPSSDSTYYAVWSTPDTTNPTGSISSTNNVASSQTVTLKLSDNIGVAGYYWGTSSTYANNTYSSTSASSAAKTVSSSGTYYLTVKDTSGNVSTTYSVTFYKTTLNANGGSVSPTSVLTEKGKSFTFPTPSYSGKTYAGWSTSSSASTGIKSLTPSSDSTYYAVWSTPDTTKPTGSIYSTDNVASNQTVSLNMRDNIGVAGYYWGTSSSYSNNTYYGLSSPVTSLTATKEVSSNGTYYYTVKDSDGNVSPTYSITFYKTTLNANGGSVSPSSVLTEKGKSFTFPTPSYSGKTYAGWSTSSSASTGIKSLTPSSDSTYYAVWSTPDTTKPTGSISSTNNVASSQTVTLKLSDNIDVAGYYWGTSSTYENNTYASTSNSSVTKTVSSARTYYLTVKDTSGNVSETYSITFFKTTLNANGGSVSPTSVLTEKGKSFTFPTPSYSGKTYAGWSTSSSASTGIKSLTPSSDSTYYAVWSTPDTTKPTGSISSTNNVASSQTVTLKLSDNIGVAGYYWGTSSTYENNTYASTSNSSVTKTVSSARTYYLTVKDTSGNVSETYSITFYKTTLNANGGSVSPSSILTEKGKSFTFPTPSYTGHTYNGWATSSTAASGIKSLSPKTNATYYVIWSIQDSDFLPGDVNLDGKVTAADARLALRRAVGLETYDEGSVRFRASDVNHDGRITAADARLILRAAVGLEKLS